MRSLLTLLVVLVLLVGLWLSGLVVPGPFSPDPFHENTGPKVAPLPALEVRRVARIDIKDGQGSLRLRWTGKTWTLPDRADYPAKASQVETALKHLQDLDRPSKAGFRASNPSLHEIYSVKGDGRTRVTLRDDGDVVLLDLVIGKMEDPVKDGNPRARAVFVREASRNDVFGVNEPALAHAFMTRPQGWMDVRVFGHEPTAQQELMASVTEIEIEGLEEPPVAESGPAGEESRPLVHTRLRLVAEEVEEEAPAAATPDGSGVLPRPAGNTPPAESAPADAAESKPKVRVVKWRVAEPEGRADLEVYEPIVKSILQSAFVMSFDDIAGGGEMPEAGFDNPRLRLTLRMKDGGSHRIVFGRAKVPESAPAEASGRAMPVLLYMKADDPKWTFLVNEWREKSFRKKPEDLRKPEPPPGTGAVPGRPGQDRPPILLPEEGAETRR